jgi:hypothetical protein
VTKGVDMGCERSWRFNLAADGLVRNLKHELSDARRTQIVGTGAVDSCCENRCRVGYGGIAREEREWLDVNKHKRKSF